MKNNLRADLERKHEKAVHTQQNAITWILLCDSEKAKLFVSQGDGKALEEMRDDKQGHGISKSYKSTDPQASPADKREDKFIAGIASKINSQEDSFTRLVIVAPPNTLHELRNVLAKNVQVKIIGELNKNLMHENASTLPHHIKHFFDVKDSQDYQQTGTSQTGGA
ncbi:MAG: protein required for attachment to host cells [Alphaproteobacteria bacterium]|jgi:protein required for attachment to host cells